MVVLTYRLSNLSIVESYMDQKNSETSWMEPMSYQELLVQVKPKPYLVPHVEGALPPILICIHFHMFLST